MVTNTLKLFSFPIICHSAPDEGYYRNASWALNLIYMYSQTCIKSRGGSRGGAHPARIPPKIGKKMICWRKIVIFHTSATKTGGELRYSRRTSISCSTCGTRCATNPVERADINININIFSNNSLEWKSWFWSHFYSQVNLIHGYFALIQGKC